MNGVRLHVLLSVSLFILALAACGGQEDETPVPVGTPAVNVPTPGTSSATPDQSRQPASHSTQSPQEAESPMGATPTLQESATSEPSATPEPSTTVEIRPTVTRQIRPPATVVPSQTATERATIVPTVGPSVTATSPPAIIHRFELVAEEELNPGKRLTFAWSAEGAVARILGGTRQRFMPWWQVPVSDTLTVELTQTLFHDPVFSLEVVAEAGPPIPWESAVRETIEVEWPCTYDYFFTPAPSRRCPNDSVRSISAADQAFQGGRMLWLAPDEKILVLYGDGRELSMMAFDDTWSPDEAESDPALQPPPGLYQPVRGFGKVWRANPEVREALGWALAPEVGYHTEWQFEANESIGTVSYFRLNDGRLIRVSGYYVGVGKWEFYEPETASNG